MDPTRKKAITKEATIRIASKFDEEYEPLIIRGDDDAEDRENKPFSTLFKVGSVVVITLAIIAITIGAAMYKIEEEKTIVSRAHASLVAEHNDDLCILETAINNNNCAHETTKFLVPATENGNWPAAFSMHLFTGKDWGTLVHSENGQYSKSSSPVGMKCKSFLTELCLDGDYLLYAYSKTDARVTANVFVCEKYRLESGDAMSFHVASDGSKAVCSEDSFKNANVKLHLRDSIQNLPNLNKAEQDTVIVSTSAAQITTDTKSQGNKVSTPSLRSSIQAEVLSPNRGLKEISQVDDVNMDKQELIKKGAKERAKKSVDSKDVSYDRVAKAKWTEIYPDTNLKKSVDGAKRVQLAVSSEKSKGDEVDADSSPIVNPASAYDSMNEDEILNEMLSEMSSAAKDDLDLCKLLKIGCTTAPTPSTLPGTVGSGTPPTSAPVSVIIGDKGNKNDESTTSSTVPVVNDVSVSDVAPKAMSKEELEAFNRQAAFEKFSGRLAVEEQALQEKEAREDKNAALQDEKDYQQLQELLKQREIRTAQKNKELLETLKKQQDERSKNRARRHQTELAELQSEHTKALNRKRKEMALDVRPLSVKPSPTNAVHPSSFDSLSKESAHPLPNTNLKSSTSSKHQTLSIKGSGQRKRN